jgi:hypothetical protein
MDSETNLKSTPKDYGKFRPSLSEIMANFSQVVSEISATLPGFDSLGLDTDHSRLNKFSSRGDSNYRLVSSEVAEMVEGCLGKMRARDDRLI